VCNVGPNFSSRRFAPKIEICFSALRAGNQNFLILRARCRLALVTVFEVFYKRLRNWFRNFTKKGGKQTIASAGVKPWRHCWGCVRHFLTRGVCTVRFGMATHPGTSRGERWWSACREKISRRELVAARVCRGERRYLGYHSLGAQHLATIARMFRAWQPS